MRWLCALFIVVVVLSLLVLKGPLHPPRLVPSEAMKEWQAASDCLNRGENEEEAARHLRNALKLTPRSDYPLGWAYLQKHLGMSLSDQARGCEGTEAGLLLSEAVVAYRAALEVPTLDSPSMQLRLADVLEELGNQKTGAEQRELWLEAEKAYAAALQIGTNEISADRLQKAQQKLDEIREKLPQ